MGFFWALLSVGLVSAAQLLLRSAMVALPPLTDIVAFLQHLLHFQPGTFGLFFGLLGYLLSLLVWGWLLGPVGMLLSVPLTSVCKIWMETTVGGSKLAILLGPGRPKSRLPG